MILFTRILDAVGLFISYGVTIIIVAVVLLMLLRLLVSSADLNPFAWPARTVRNFSDPLVNPIRRALIGFGFDPKFAPLVVILIVILLGWFTIKLAASILWTIANVADSARNGAPVRLVGFLLYGLLDIYALLIFIRIVFSWGMVSHRNRLMRFLASVTDPLLVPLRRTIPPLGPFDISPIVAFILLWLFKEAIAGTLLR